MGNNQSVSSSLLDLNNVSYGNSASSLNSSLPSSKKDTSTNNNTGDDPEHNKYHSSSRGRK